MDTTGQGVHGGYVGVGVFVRVVPCSLKPGVFSHHAVCRTCRNASAHNRCELNLLSIPVTKSIFDNVFKFASIMRGPLKNSLVLHSKIKQKYAEILFVKQLP